MYIITKSKFQWGNVWKFAQWLLTTFLVNNNPTDQVLAARSMGSIPLLLHLFHKLFTVVSGTNLKRVFRNTILNPLTRNWMLLASDVVALISPLSNIPSNPTFTVHLSRAIALQEICAPSHFPQLKSPWTWLQILSPIFHLFYFGVWIFPYLPVQAFGSSNHQNNSKLRVYSL